MIRSDADIYKSDVCDVPVNMPYLAQGGLVGAKNDIVQAFPVLLGSNNNFQ